MDGQKVIMMHTSDVCPREEAVLLGIGGVGQSSFPWLDIKCNHLFCFSIHRVGEHHHGVGNRTTRREGLTHVTGTPCRGQRLGMTVRGAGTLT